MTTAQKVYNHLRDKMVTGGFPPGSRLREEHIAAELGVSRTPVRQAIHMLEGEGLLEIRANEGAKCRVPAPKEVKQFIELRKIIDLAMTRKAVRGVTEDEISVMRECVDKMRDIVELLGHLPEPAVTRELAEKWLRVDVEFHRMIAKAAGNREAMRVSENLQILIQNFFFNTVSYSSDLFSQMSTMCSDHVIILQAFEKRDTRATVASLRKSLNRLRVSSVK